MTPKSKDKRPDYPLAPTDKAAALLLCMEKPLASRIIRYFDDADVRLIAESTSRLGTLSQQRLEELVGEFASAFASGSDLQGTPESTAHLLEGIVATETLNNLMSDIVGDPSGKVWTALSTIPNATLAEYLMKQHPQVATYVLSRLASSLAASVLEQFPPVLRVEIIRRMLSLKEVAPDALRILEENLRSDPVSNAVSNPALNAHARIASVLNKMNQEAADMAVSELNASRPEDAAKLRGLLFNFSDVARLSDDSRAKLFESIAVEQTIAALHGADTELSGLILNVLSQRGRRMIEAELQNGRAPPKSEIARAQRAVADRALELVERGTIELGGSD